MSDVWIIRSTFASKDEAVSVARTLLEERQVACANVEETATSLYRWEGTIQQEQETVMLLKTTKAHVESVIARIKTLHSYQIPSITSWPSIHTEPAFGAWVGSEVL